MACSFLKRALYRLGARAAWRRLNRLSGTRIAAAAETAALRAFRRAARRVPAYGKLLARHGLDPGSVRDTESFQRLVPLTDKTSVFSENDIAALCAGGKADDAACVYTSSGYSGEFSFGLETAADADRGRARLDLLLEMYLHATSRRTLLINALPMGVQTPASLPMRLETSVRADAILAVVKKLKDVCRQLVIVGEHPFLKKVVEDGAEAGIHWPDHRLSLVTGAEVMPENFRKYVGGILGHDQAEPDKGRIIVSTGISEVGLTIGHETDGCRRLRQAAVDDKALREALFGPAPFLPTCVQYFPDMYYMETPCLNGQTTLVITTSSPRRKLPLIRYCTGDWARVLNYKAVCKVLEECGRTDLRPPVELPLLLMWGRGRCLVAAGRQLYPEEIKEAIYSNPLVAVATTANFRMTETAGRAAIRFQLKPGFKDSAALIHAFSAAILTATGLHAEVRLIPYEQFADSLELSYQRKFRYL